MKVSQLINRLRSLSMDDIILLPDSDGLGFLEAEDANYVWVEELKNNQLCTHIPGHRMRAVFLRPRNRGRNGEL